MGGYIVVVGGGGGRGGGRKEGGVRWGEGGGGWLGEGGGRGGGRGKGKGFESGKVCKVCLQTAEFAPSSVNAASCRLSSMKNKMRAPPPPAGSPRVFSGSERTLGRRTP